LSQFREKSLKNIYVYAHFPFLYQVLPKFLSSKVI
jgi:hypothetical protein